MSVAALALVLLAAMIGLAVVLNHAHARVALVELTLNEGLPPGHAVVDAGSTISGPADSGAAAEMLEGGVHVFLSRTCHACQRLIEELEHRPLGLTAPLFLRYVDRPRPTAAAAAQRQQAALREHDYELAERVGADPLPFTVAVGKLGLLSASVSPTAAQIVQTARDAGIGVSAVDAP